MNHRQARELAAMLHARFEEAWSVAVHVGEGQYEAHLYLDGSVLRTSTLIDALNFVLWCDR